MFRWRQTHVIGNPFYQLLLGREAFAVDIFVHGGTVQAAVLGQGVDLDVFIFYKTGEKRGKICHMGSSWFLLLKIISNHWRSDQPQVHVSVTFFKKSSSF